MIMTDRPYLIIYVILFIIGVAFGIVVQRTYTPKTSALDIFHRMQRMTGVVVCHNVYVLEEDGTRITAKVLTMEDGNVTGKHVTIRR